MTQIAIQSREYQQRDIKSIEEAWLEHQGVMFQLPTGGGKSVIATQIVVNHKKERILILAHRRRLLFQLRDHLAKQGIKAGLLVAEIEDNLDSNVIIASIRTIVRDKRQSILEKGFDRIIIDEAHHTMIGSYQKLLDKMSSMYKSKLLGITATPYRNDLLSFEKYYSKLICSDDVQSLIRQGYLSRYKVFYTSVDDIDSEVEKVGNEYQVTSLSNYMRREKYIKKAIEAYKLNGQEKQTLLYCLDKQHAQDVQQSFIDEGYTKIGYIDSDVSEEKREKILQKYANKELQFIVCVETLTEGVDLPETGCILMLRPTNSIVLYLQIVGRGLRPKEDGSMCIILDCSGNTVKHGTPSSPKAWSLDCKTHPNKPRTKRKVVVRKSDGKFTEDDEEMEFGELVELSEEEYVLSIASSIEKFREENSTVDDLIVLEYEKLSKLLDTIKLPTDIRLNKIEKFRHKEFDETVINFIYQFQLQLIHKEEKEHDIDWQSIFTDGTKTYTNSYHSLEVEKITVFLEVKYNSYYSTSSLEHYHIRQKISEATLIMNQFLYKNRDKITEIFHSILELSSRKHDIDALNRSIKEHQKQAFIRSIEENIERDGEITFTLKQAEDIDLQTLNRNWIHTGLSSLGWCKRYIKNPNLIDSESTTREIEEIRNRRFVKKIVFTKKKLSQYNDATFYNFNDEVLETTTNQNLYKEKLMLLLENLNTEE